MERRNLKGSGSEFPKLRDAGIDAHPDGNCYVMHHKVIVLDGQHTITGSFNFTGSAQDQNDENVLVIDDRSLAALYSAEFERIYDQALHPPRCAH
jgi:phosphatidylserine/phosphatidylglycerophosphate/cardiolipin synthase-like enzyme